MSYLSNIPRMYAMRFLHNFHLMGGVLIPFFTQFGRLGYTQILLLQSWFMLWIFLLEIPTGVVADRFGRKWSVALASFFAAIGLVVYTSMANFYVFMLAEFLFAVGVALMSGADQALLYDSLKADRKEKTSKQVFSSYQIAALLGITLASPLGSWVASWAGVVAPVYLTAVPALAAGFLVFTLREPPRGKKAVSESRRYMDILKTGLRYFRRTRALRVLALDMAFVGIAAYFMIWFFQTLLGNAGVGILWFGVVHAAMTLVQVAVLARVAWFERALGSRQHFVTFSTLAVGVGFLTAALTSWVPAVIFSILLVAAFGLTRQTVLENYAQKWMPSEERATINSSISAFRRLGIVIMNPLVGWAADLSFSGTLLLIGAATLAFAFVSETAEHMLRD